MEIELTNDPRYVKIDGEEVRLFNPSPEFMAKWGPKMFWEGTATHKGKKRKAHPSLGGNESDQRTKGDLDKG